MTFWYLQKRDFILARWLLHLLTFHLRTSWAVCPAAFILMGILSSIPVFTQETDIDRAFLQKKVLEEPPQKTGRKKNGGQTSTPLSLLPEVA